MPKKGFKKVSQEFELENSVSNFEEYEEDETYKEMLKAISKIGSKPWYLYDFSKDFNTLESFLNTKGRVII